MTEPTAEHLKAAQEWLEQHMYLVFSERNVHLLAALLASRETYCPSCGRPGECACLGNAVERAEAAEARLRRVVEAAQRAVDETAWEVRDAARENLQAVLAAAQSSEERMEERQAGIDQGQQ